MQGWGSPAGSHPSRFSGPSIRHGHGDRLSGGRRFDGILRGSSATELLGVRPDLVGTGFLRGHHRSPGDPEPNTRPLDVWSREASRTSIGSSAVARASFISPPFPVLITIERQRSARDYEAPGPAHEDVEKKARLSLASSRKQLYNCTH